MYCLLFKQVTSEVTIPYHKFAVDNGNIPEEPETHLHRFQKAFNCCSWQELRVQDHLIRLIRSHYNYQESTVQIPHRNTDWFKISKGMRQGCILSRFLFNLWEEVIMKKLYLEESEIGVKISGWNINNLWYTDTTLLSETEDGRQNLIKWIKDKCKVWPPPELQKYYYRDNSWGHSSQDNLKWRHTVHSKIHFPQITDESEQWL